MRSQAKREHIYVDMKDDQDFVAQFVNFVVASLRIVERVYAQMKELNDVCDGAGFWILHLDGNFCLLKSLLEFSVFNILNRIERNSSDEIESLMDFINATQ